jgi:hypothetical protein
MPCGCILDKPEYPQNNEWGPILWKIIHTLAERSGTIQNTYIQADERRAWSLFLKTLVTMIPCPYCKEHAQAYVLQHPFELPSEYYNIHEYVRTWFYNFHEAVNARIEKPSFPYAELATTYKNGSVVKSSCHDLEKINMKAIKMGGVSLLAWNAWLKEAKILRGLFGI